MKLMTMTSFREVLKWLKQVYARGVAITLKEKVAVARIAVYFMGCIVLKG